MVQVSPSVAPCFGHECRSSSSKRLGHSPLETLNGQDLGFLLRGTRTVRRVT